MPDAEKDVTQWADPCPACGAAAGSPCHVPLSGVDTTGWAHDARILLPIYRDLRCVTSLRCPCGHGEELHDREAEPVLCMVCGGADTCVLPPEVGKS